MANFVNKYNDMTAYNADSTKQYPNTSKVVSEGKVLFQREDPNVIYATFNVQNGQTKVLVTYNPSAFTKIEYDGNEIELVETYKYDFQTSGRHTLKYTLASNTSIPEKSFGWCYQLVEMSKLPDTITSIGTSAFLGNKFTSITIPSGVTSIGGSAFSDCQNLTSITIPNSVTTIGINAFTQCRGATSVTIGSGVTSIGGEAFNGCDHLVSVTVLATTPPTGVNNYTNTFMNTNNCPIYVPAESLTAYQTAWSAYASRIQAIPNP